MQMYDVGAAWQFEFQNVRTRECICAFDYVSEMVCDCMKVWQGASDIVTVSLCDLFSMWILNIVMGSVSECVSDCVRMR